MFEFSLKKSKAKFQSGKGMVREAESGEDEARRRVKDLVRRTCPRAEGRGAGMVRGGEAGGGRRENRNQRCSLTCGLWGAKGERRRERG
jgi:hypothetical protein